MTAEELLNPRVICTSTGKLHYPASPFEIGDILILKMYADGKEKYGILDDEGFPEILLLKRVVDDCPHLFKSLQWWEHREESDMPEYVKCISTPDQIHFPPNVYKVKWGNIWGYDEMDKAIVLSTNCYEPATQSEYDNKTK